MDAMIELISNERSQYSVLISLSLVVAGLVGILYRRDKLAFQSFIGRLNPLLAIVLIILVGIMLLSLLLSRGWFAICGSEALRGLASASGLAALLALVMILVDRRAPLPADINVAFPDSLLFYPAIAYVVEVIFHVLPLSLLLMVLTSLSKNLGYGTVIWPCLVFVSLLEPVYHTVFNVSRQYPVSTTAYIALHVFLINLLQLLTFKRYDFVSMYGFRLAYYILWHILWGHVRLSLLF
jgi:hypothetical protein